MFSTGKRADGQNVDEGDVLAETAAEDGGEDAQGQHDDEHEDGEWCREDEAACLEVLRDVADEERMHEVGEVRVLAEDVQQRVERLRIFLVGEDSEEEE